MPHATPAPFGLPDPGTRHRIGGHGLCRYCGQDIQNEGRRQWIDRGGNRSCVSFADYAGTLHSPRTRHAPNN